MSINKLSTQLLMDSYKKAKQLKLGEDFIRLLGNEIHRRKFEVIGSSFEAKTYI